MVLAMVLTRFVWLKGCFHISRATIDTYQVFDPRALELANGLTTINGSLGEKQFYVSESFKVTSEFTLLLLDWH